MSFARKQTTSIQSKVVAELEAAPDARFVRPWETWELEVLKKYYGVKSTELIAKLLKRSIKAISVKYSELSRAGEMGKKK